MKTVLMMSATLNVALALGLFFALDRLNVMKEKLAFALHRLGLQDSVATRQSGSYGNRAPAVKAEAAKAASQPNEKTLREARIDEACEVRKTPEPSWMND